MCKLEHQFVLCSFLLLALALTSNVMGQVSLDDLVSRVVERKPIAANPIGVQILNDKLELEVKRIFPLEELGTKSSFFEFERVIVVDNKIVLVGSDSKSNMTSASLPSFIPKVPDLDSISTCKTMEELDQLLGNNNDGFTNPMVLGSFYEGRTNWYQGWTRFFKVGEGFVYLSVNANLTKQGRDGTVVVNSMEVFRGEFKPLSRPRDDTKR